MFASLFRRLTQAPGHKQKSRQPSRRFLPQVTALEDRSLPSVSHLPALDFAPAGIHAAAAQQKVQFKEDLTLVAALPTADGVYYVYVGQTNLFGPVSSIVYPDDTFTKTTANGDTATGYITHTTATTGTINFTGGTGVFAGVTGSTDAVIKIHPVTGAVTVHARGKLTVADPDQLAPRNTFKGHQFKTAGAGFVPDGLPVFVGGTASHTASGTASKLGSYTGEGVYQLLSIDLMTGTGTFQTADPFVMTNPRGDKLALHYGRTDMGAELPGRFMLIPKGDGTVYAVFVAEFTPYAPGSTGRFTKASGSFIMVAVSEAISPVPNMDGYTQAFNYTWMGAGSIRLGNG